MERSLVPSFVGMPPLIAVGALLIVVSDVYMTISAAMTFITQGGRRCGRRFGHATQLESHPTLIGGTYVGLAATFDSLNGKHIPIDEIYIPSSLLEWGYPPSTLEVVVSETISPAPTGSTDDESWINMTRSIATILPATGCDVDNLETIRSLEKWDAARTFYHYDGDDAFISFSATSTISNIDSRATSEPTIRLESCFGWTLPDAAQSTLTDKNALTNSSSPKDLDQYRTRISVDVGYSHRSSSDTLSDGWKFVSPIRVAMERQLPLSDRSSTALDSINSGGGGLDARTVAKWLGHTLNTERMRSFPVNTNIEQSTWAPLALRVTADESDGLIAYGMFLPGNLTISVRDRTEMKDGDVMHANETAGRRFCKVKVGHIKGRLNSTPDSTLMRHIITFHLPSPSQGDDVSSDPSALSGLPIANACTVTSCMERSSKVTCT